MFFIYIYIYDVFVSLCVCVSAHGCMDVWMYRCLDHRSTILELGWSATRLGIMGILVNEGSTTSGWWYTYPSEKYDFVSWGYYSQHMIWKNN